MVKATTKIILSNKDLGYIPNDSINNHSLDANIISDYKDVDPGIQSKNYVLKDYNQTAVNINIIHKNSNNNIPRQVFFNNEILGFLPVNEY